MEQGLYKYYNGIKYLAYLGIEDSWYARNLQLGTRVGGYSEMIKVPKVILSKFVLIAPGWLPNDAVPSDLYPELFI